MRKLTAVGKDSELPSSQRKLEIHWKGEDGKTIIDAYPGDAKLTTDDSGMTMVIFTRIAADGSREQVKVTYNYGEARKIVETIVSPPLH